MNDAPKTDRRKTEQFREAARERARAQWASPETRARHGVLTRERMASPTVRDELAALRLAWKTARLEAKKIFVLEILSANKVSVPSP
jgi:hypothetical protein